MKSGTINSSWLSLHPTGRMDAKYWLEVIAWMDTRELAHTHESVKMAIAGVEADATAKLAQAKELRRQADALMEEARAVEQTIVTGTGKKPT